VSWLVSAQLVVAGIGFALGLQHAFVWLRRRSETAYLLIAIAAAAASANALVEVGMYTATTAEQYGAAIQWSVAFIALFLGALVWFVVVWTATARRRLAVAATCALAAVLVVNFASPFSIVYSNITALEPLDLPWGEVVASAVGTTSPWKLLGDVPGFLLVVLVIDACVRLWRRGNRRRAWIVGLTLGAVLPALTVHEFLVDLGVIQFPYVLSFAFLAALLVLSFEVAGAVARAGELSEEVVERKRDQVDAQEARDSAVRELEELKRQLEEENVFLRQELETTHGFTEVVGESDALRYVLHRVEQVANADTTVLIEGETGVGKELVARAIHRRSRRANRPFITVDCGSLPPNLIESELFGHEKGAFTGATELRKGRFELADRGTIFLDEIGELQPDLQVKLLRVLESGAFSRLGASRMRSVDVRVIAATNRHLEAEVSEGRLREDLFYRIHVFPITVPPLRERQEDIPLLVHHFVRRLAARLDKEIESIPGPTMRRLTGYGWPGNVRELENVLERSVILSTGSVLSLPPGFEITLPSNSGPIRTDPRVPLDELEREHIRNVLASTDWKIEGEDGAAARLGLKPSTLRSRMKKHDIQRMP
jgi:DNA-binding NtrC family response regulator